jgi:hypothetical protein
MPADRRNEAMSDWNRYGREDDQRRFGSSDRERRDLGREDSYGQYGDWRDRERRSFGERDQDGWGWRRGEEAQGRYGQGGYGQGGSAERDYGAGGGGRTGYGGERGGQGYGQAWSGRDEGPPRHAEETTGRAYGQADYGRQGFGSGGDQRGRGVVGGNQRLEEITDGDYERGFGARFGREGEHRGRGPKNYTRSDDRIREDVNDRLSDDSWLDASEIEIQVASGEVTLTGTVSSREDKRRAEDLAEAVSGVKHVQNNLRVQPTEAQQGTRQGAGAQGYGQGSTAQGRNG